MIPTTLPSRKSPIHRPSPTTLAPSKTTVLPFTPMKPASNSNCLESVAPGTTESTAYVLNPKCLHRTKGWEYRAWRLEINHFFEPFSLIGF